MSRRKPFRFTEILGGLDRCERIVKNSCRSFSPSHTWRSHKGFADLNLKF
ncbi:MAG: hypothetical protein ACUVTP_09120 [Candidatus Fervidibacter sp.]